MAEEAGGFLSRWARRKEQARSGVELAPEPPPLAGQPNAVVPSVSPVSRADAVAAPVSEPLPTLADVALLSRESDYARFVASGVDEGVKQAAMKKLFTDPHFNIMDGLDTYIDDYGQPDPIPLAMLRQMNQSKFLRLFDDEEAPLEAKNDTAPAMVAMAAEPLNPSDDDADLRLQQDDAAGRPGPDQGLGA